MSWLSHAAGQKSPDNMTRKELLICIKSFDTYLEAEQFWLKWALGKVSKQSFMKARGF